MLFLVVFDTKNGIDYTPLFIYKSGHIISYEEAKINMQRAGARILRVLHNSAAE